MLDLAPCLQLVDIPPSYGHHLSFNVQEAADELILCTRVRYWLSALHEGEMSAPDRLLTGDWFYEQTPFKKEIESKNINLLCRQKIILSDRLLRPMCRGWNMFLYISLAAAHDENSYVQWFRFDFLFLDLLETNGRQITDPGWKILHVTIFGIGDLKMCRFVSDAPMILSTQCSSKSSIFICNMSQ